MLPGTLDLASGWELLEAAGTEDPAVVMEQQGWQEVRFSDAWVDPGLGSSEVDVVWLRRPTLLPRNWEESVAPGGWALFLEASGLGWYEVFIGGEPVGRYGGPRQTHPSPRPRVFDLPDEAITGDGRFEILIAYHRSPWRFETSVARLEGPVEALLGDRRVMQRRLELRQLEHLRSRYPAALIIGLLAAIGLYHLQFFYRRRDSKELLWFGHLALVGALLTLFTNFGSTLFSSLALERRLVESLGHLTVALTVEFFWALVRRLVPRSLRIYQGMHAAIAVILLLVPGITLVASTQLVRWLLLLPMFGAMGWLVLQEMRGGKGEQFTLVMAGLAVPCAAVCDAVLLMYGHRSSITLAVLAFAWLGISMALSISNRFSQVHLELDELRLRLEEKVEDRTVELARTNERLSSEVKERRRVEEALRMLERAVEQSIDGVAVVDPAGSTQFLNAAWAEMHGHGVFDVLGYDLSIFHSPEQMQAEIYPLMSQVRERGAFQGEVGHRRKDGTSFPAWTSVTLLQDESRRPVGMLFIARDITDRRRADEEQLRLEARARQVDKLESLSVLSSGIAHDFNNLLTGILGNTGLALRDLPEGNPSRDMVQQIERAAERAATLSDQLLSYAGEDRLQLRPMALGQLVESFESSLREVLPEEASLQFQLRPGLPDILLDREQIRIALVNLVRNAGDALPEGRGVVTVRTSRRRAERSYFDGAVVDDGLEAGDYVFFEVSDSGVGIDEGVRNRMFDPFYSTKGTSRGLGLAQSLGIVRAHGGTIKVYSEPGRGSTFEVLLPVRQEKVVAPPPEEKITWRGGGTVLVVDDEELVREVAEDILEQQGFEVLTASDGRIAVETFAGYEGKVRLVILDLTMPEMNGEEAFHAIRGIDPEVRVLLMSGYSQDRALERLMGAGLAGFLHKPFRPRDLLVKVQEALADEAED